MKDIYFVLHKLAEENRHILSDWRTRIIFQRSEPNLYDLDRKVNRVVRKLDREGLIEPVWRKTLFKVTCPYARKDVNIYELLGEAYYSGVFCYSTALELHQLTDQRSRKIRLFLGEARPGQIVRSPEKGQSETSLHIPPGTKPAEWRLSSLPQQSRIEEFDGFEVKTHRLKSSLLFGSEEKEARGIPVRCTDLERSLIDGLRYPKYCGGLSEVFRAWVRSLERLSVEKLVDYTEQFDQLILYQRVGFVMKVLRLKHDKLKRWRKEKTPRGGSRVLNPDRDYSSTYDDDWNISINHPISILENRDVSYS